MTAYGCCVAVDLPRSLTPSLSAAMPPGYSIHVDGPVPQRLWSMSFASDGSVQAFAEGGVLVTDPDVSLVRDVLVSDLELWVAEHSPERVFVHAGCVAIGDRAIVLPGRSMAGKSTLVEALTLAGATYFSDEYALIDSQGFVWPYARPLSIRPADGGRQRRLPLSELGGSVGHTPARVALICNLRYDPEGPWEVREVRQGEVVLSLIDNAVAARRSPEAVLTALVAATEGVTAIRGTRDDAGFAARRLLEFARALQPAIDPSQGFPFVGSAI